MDADHILFLSIFAPMGLFGGLALFIRSIGRARIEQIKAHQQMAQPSSNTPAVLAELQALKQQIGEMQSTGHQFDLSFDAALNRLEDRVSRVETKTAVLTTAAPTEPQPLQNGYRP